MKNRSINGNGASVLHENQYFFCYQLALKEF